VILQELNLDLLHEFIGLEDGVAFELYWAEFDHNDIERESQGHKINEKE
jgi:hypothetical protein